MNTAPLQRRSKSAAHLFQCSLLVCALSGLAGLAQAQDALLQNAQGLIANKQASQAYDLLSQQETARAGQPEFDYLLGIAALDSGRVTQAVFALERVLAVQPNNSLARAELSRAYIAAGEADTAKIQLQQIRSAPDVPAPARERIERLLASLELGAQKKPLKLYVEAGLGHDSNLSGGPNIATFAVPSLGGLVFNLSPAAKERGDGITMLGAGLSYQDTINAGTEVQAQLNFRTAQPHSEKQLDSDNIDTSIGIAHTVGANRYNASLQLSRLNFDGKTSRTTAGVSAQWLHTLSKSQQLMAFIQYAQLRYPSPGANNAKRNVIGGAWGLTLSNATTAYLGAAFGGEQADKVASKEVGFQLTGLRAGAEHAISAQMRAFVNLGFEQRRHRAADPFFLRTRRDQQTDLTLGAHYSLAPSGYGQWRITPQVNFTQRGSNITVYELKRTQLSLTARLEF